MPDPVVNRAVADARTLPHLIENLRAADPELATRLEGKSAIGSKTMWGVPATWIVGWLVARYGWGWDPETQTLVAGLLTGVVAVLLRLVTSAPITRLFPKGNAP